jgi:putative hydrolase of the HAD superfamily
MENPHIQAISFDVDGTLLDFDTVMYEALQVLRNEIVRRFGRAGLSISTSELRSLRDQVAAEWSDRVVPMEEIRRESIRRGLARFGVSDPASTDDLLRIYMRHRFDAIRPFPEVVPALRVLRSRFQLGVASNGNSYPAACGLPDVFSFEVFSESCGCRKPSPEFFERVVEAAGCRPDELLHVGDSYSEDVAAARAAGVKSVWIRRSSSRESSGGSEAFTCSGLDQLTTALDHGDEY